MPYISLIISFVFRVLCRRWTLKRSALYVVLKHSFFNHLPLANYGICGRKEFFFSNSPLVSYGIVYCILAMVAWFKGNKFFICHPRTGFFSTSFSRLKLRFKDDMICCFAVEKTGTKVEYVSLISFFIGFQGTSWKIRS